MTQPTPVADVAPVEPFLTGYDMDHLVTYLRLALNDGGPKQGLRSIAQRVMSLAKVYDHLLGNGPSRTIDFDQYVRSLCEGLTAFQGDREFHVTLTCEGEPEPLLLDLDSVTALGIVIAEIISNAYVHAFPERAGAIRVALTRSATGALLTIGDDGIGFVEPPTSKRHGLGLVRRLMEQIGGAVRVVSDRGTKWTLAFPMAAQRAVSETI